MPVCRYGAKCLSATFLRCRICQQIYVLTPRFSFISRVACFVLFSLFLFFFFAATWA